MKDIASRVRYARKKRGLAMHALALRAGLSNAYISLFERKTWPDPGISTVIKLAEALDVSLDWLALERGAEPNWEKFEKPVETPSVYFIQRSEGPIKIGFSINPRIRLHQLRGGAASKLTLLAAMPGTRGDERALHARFASVRVHREWFQPVPELLELVASLKNEAAA